MAQDPWYLGQTSEHYETGGRGPGSISHTPGDPGGPSYGLSQFALNTGSLQEYLDHSRYATTFKGLEPGSPAFDTKWHEVAQTDAAGFAQDQHDFTKTQFYDVQNARLKADGLDLSQRGPAVQDALWSTSVQFRGLTPDIFEKGLEGNFGRGYELSKLSDKDIVGAVQDYKISHNDHLFHRSSAAVKASVLERAREEKADLLRLADGKTVDHAQHAQLGHAASSMRQGQPVQAVTELQADLAQLGYTDRHGKPLAADGTFGTNTRYAVERFQHDHHLTVDGIAGPMTLKALDQAHARNTNPGLDNPTHADHALFLQAQRGVHQIDAERGRTPDQHSDNLAAALTVQARHNNLTCIDQVALSVDGERAFAVQNGVLTRHAQVPTAEAVQTSIEQSSDAWQQVMQQRHPHPAQPAMELVTQHSLPAQGMGR